MRAPLNFSFLRFCMVSAWKRERGGKAQYSRKFIFLYREIFICTLGFWSGVKHPPPFSPLPPHPSVPIYALSLSSSFLASPSSVRLASTPLNGRRKKREREGKKKRRVTKWLRGGSSFCVNIKKIHSVSFFTSMRLPRLHVFEIGSSGWMLGFSLTSLAMACVFVLEFAF